MTSQRPCRRCSGSRSRPTGPRSPRPRACRPPRLEGHALDDRYSGTGPIGQAVKDRDARLGAGAVAGTPDNEDLAHGIYTDDGSCGITVDSNTVSNCARSGIYVHNTRFSSFTNKTVYGCGYSQLFIVHDPASPNSPIREVTIKKNIFFSDSKTNPVVIIRTMRNDVDSFSLNGSLFDSNYYCRPFSEGLTIKIIKKVKGVDVINNYTLAGWKAAYPNYNKKSNISPVTFSSYQINNYVTPNLVTAGNFSNSIAGFNIFSQTNNVVGAWDNTNKIEGFGSLKLTMLQPYLDYVILNYKNVGAVSSSKKYLLRLTTLSSSTNILRAYLRKSVAPYTALTEKKYSDITTSQKVHEFLFDNLTSDSSATIAVDIQENAGTINLDNVELFEVDAVTLDTTNKLKFYYNAASINKSVTLSANYLSVDSTSYSDNLVLNPFSSLILIKKNNLPIPLTVSAGNDIRLIYPTDSTFLQATASAEIKSFQWAKVAGSEYFQIDGANNKRSFISKLRVGSYTFKLTVVNLAGDTAFAFIKVVVSSVLPVKLLDFSGINTADKIIVNWKTTAEINSSHYIVQKSSNGKDFENLIKVGSFNIADAKSGYSITDERPYIGNNFYRLVMVDKDGSMAYSKIILLSTKNTSSFNVSVCFLSKQNANIKLVVNSSKKQNINLELIDMGGKLIAQYSININTGLNEIEKQIPGLNNSVYAVKVSTASHQISKSLLAQ